VEGGHGLFQDPGICLEGLRKLTNNLNQNIQCPDQDLKKYKSEVLLPKSTCSMISKEN
jgi:hypothetical protein